jgi:ppGpp synthetase/RelA/SpoT-type nucleotidyltranferase
MQVSYSRVATSIRRDIEQQLDRVGLLCRVFGRGKSDRSMKKKISSSDGKYRPGGKLIQDAVGIRVVVYFQEDVPIVEQILRRKYICDDGSSTIDKPNSNEFSVSRHNLIFHLPQEYHRDIPPGTATLPVDRTFEVQIRTILSEGWHEIEHDLRYKRKADWVEHPDLSRGLNGVVATLETAEWSMRKIFDDLAYKHYRGRKWDAMLHSALRMRTTAPLSTEVTAVLEDDANLSKKLLRINRAEFFEALDKVAAEIPLTADNLVFVWNTVSAKNEKMTSITPLVIKEALQRSL